MNNIHEPLKRIRLINAAFNSTKIDQWKTLWNYCASFLLLVVQRARIILGEERKMRVLEIKMLGNICGPKREDVTGYWRILHNEELHDLYSLPDIFRVML